MATSERSPLPATLERQLARVSRRLFFQTFLDTLVWCWTGALVLGAVWFLAQPAIVSEAAPWLRWAVAGGLEQLIAHHDVRPEPKA